MDDGESIAVEYLDGFAANRQVERVPVGEPQAEGERALPLSVMGKLARGLLSLHPLTLEVVLRRYQGETYRDIARAWGVTVSAVETRHCRALRQWPALRLLFGRKRSKPRIKGAGATHTARGEHGAGEKGGKRRER
ncbi:MAG: sigma-70 region 4 domain-containing protein, partial [Kiritimatiellae bacterium]|nr:sigma-70 region 4 domain-containing protein [Kiritimatiellia bacterium]